MFIGAYNFTFKNYGKNLVVTVPLGVSKPFKNLARFPLFIDFFVSFGVKNLKPLKCLSCQQLSFLTL